jgi:hypothetical protein
MALTDNLQAFYKLSDTSDSSGNNRTLTNNGNVSFASGKLGNAATINGNWFSTNETLNLANNFTVACWVNINSLGSLRPAVSQWQGGNGAFFIGTGEDNYVFALATPWPSGLLYGGPATLNQWVHLIGICSGSTQKFYINGVEVASQNIDPFTDLTQGTFKIGTLDGGEEFVFDGQIDAVGIWNRALSDAEVAELYNNGTGLEIDNGGNGGGGGNPTLVKMQAPVKFFGKIKFGV